MKVEILTLENILLSEEVKSVIVPGKSGQFEILNNHAPIISLLNEGTIKVTHMNDEKTDFQILGGSIEMSNNKIIILAETA
ncbi:MAG: ATP synthase F1 subunit epsilon [Flavobacteriales bacterium]|nr:ATP synthase F1 subunit epsilon [Flavobacteriales bacterium]|tara:strand:- start:599 stop:841 length:243 start_codon:yes stop_codon:yes gene_type:complete